MHNRVNFLNRSIANFDALTCIIKICYLFKKFTFLMHFQQYARIGRHSAKKAGGNTTTCVRHRIIYFCIIIATEEEGKQRTSEKEICGGHVDSRFQVQLNESMEVAEQDTAGWSQVAGLCCTERMIRHRSGKSMCYQRRLIYFSSVQQFGFLSIEIR